MHAFPIAADVMLGVEHFGDAAAPLVLLAGGPTMLSWLDALCETLAHGGRHVVRYDLRDAGASTTVNPTAPTYTLRDLAADAAALARGLDDRPAHLGGIGVGGMVAQIAALDHPDAFSALTLAGTRPVAPGRVDADLPDHDAATMKRLFSRSMPDWSDRASVAEFAATRAEILGDDPPRRARPPSASSTARRARSPRSRWPTSSAWSSPSSTASRAGASACPRSRSRRSWCTVAATRSSPSATARRSRARSLARGCSCSNRPRPRSPTRPPTRSLRRCSRCGGACDPGPAARRPPSRPRHRPLPVPLPCPEGGRQRPQPPRRPGELTNPEIEPTDPPQGPLHAQASERPYSMPVRAITLAADLSWERLTSAPHPAVRRFRSFLDLVAQQCHAVVERGGLDQLQVSPILENARSLAT